MSDVREALERLVDELIEYARQLGEIIGHNSMANIHSPKRRLDGARARLLRALPSQQPAAPEDGGVLVCSECATEDAEPMRCAMDGCGNAALYVEPVGQAAQETLEAPGS